MTRTGTIEFRRKFREFGHKAQTASVEITRYGRRHLVLMSADHYDWLRATAQRTHRTEEAAAVVVEAVQRAEMDPALAHLDELMN
jgi:prevent-host-death family protein